MTTGKKIPTFKTDKAARHFVATADLSTYDLRGQPMSVAIHKVKLHPWELHCNGKLIARLDTAAKAEAWLNRMEASDTTKEFTWSITKRSGNAEQS